MIAIQTVTETPWGQENNSGCFHSCWGTLLCYESDCIDAFANFKIVLSLIPSNRLAKILELRTIQETQNQLRTLTVGRWQDSVECEWVHFGHFSTFIRVPLQMVLGSLPSRLQFQWVGCRRRLLQGVNHVLTICKVALTNKQGRELSDVGGKG